MCGAILMVSVALLSTAAAASRSATFISRATTRENCSGGEKRADAWLGLGLGLGIGLGIGLGLGLGIMIGIGIGIGIG
jgi:hypothetical protein